MKVKDLPRCERVPLVLIVDDEPEIGEELLDWLDATGIPGLTVTSAADALRTLEEYPSIRVMLTDFKMPHQDGLALLVEANSILPETRVLHFIVMTGHLTEESIQRISSGKVSAVLPKPLDIDCLTPLINSLLSKSEGTQ